VDTPAAYFAAYDGNVAEPNVISVNPRNGHAHVSYCLTVPVLRQEQSKSYKFLQAVKRGYTRRLEADTAYCGLIVKNPLHDMWRTSWHKSEP
jgi:hypothetical protein